jgi:hypothetical protein
VQNAHRRAAYGIWLKHAGHSRASSSTASPVCIRSSSSFTGLTMKKKTAATMMNVKIALKKSPSANRLLLMVKSSPLKSGCPPIAAMSGVMMSLDQRGDYRAKAAR